MCGVVKGTLKQRRQFQTVYNQGAKAVGHQMVAFALPGEPSELPAAVALVGVVASRKVGRAHRRNLAKRRLRVAFQGLAPEVDRGAWVVLVARAALAEDRVSRDGIAEEMRRLFAQLHIVGSGIASPAAKG
jgi:ribonuclease P protein component